MPGESGLSGTAGAAGSASAESPRQGDWASAVTTKVESYVSIVRDRAVTPVQRGVRYVVFGLMAALVGLLLLFVFSVAVVRVLDSYLFAGRVWASDLVVGGIFAVAGLFLSVRSRRR